MIYPAYIFISNFSEIVGSIYPSGSNNSLIVVSGLKMDVIPPSGSARVSSSVEDSSAGPCASPSPASHGGIYRLATVIVEDGLATEGPEAAGGVAGAAAAAAASAALDAGGDAAEGSAGRFGRAAAALDAG